MRDEAHSLIFVEFVAKTFFVRFVSFVDHIFNAEAQRKQSYGLWAIGTIIKQIYANLWRKYFFVQFVEFVAKNLPFVRFALFVVSSPDPRPPTTAPHLLNGRQFDWQLWGGLAA
ncbi:hypothetical protein [Herpetosiphon llansteffanensis]|uniref:hypothetical protein n=1 Tax=Herpetosiphon llansteffanensis TaxID=2094568 RepID=UPI000D7CCDB4|nr:hypothetical protein [Herpetosiphon llansteffanensis]